MRKKKILGIFLKKMFYICTPLQGFLSPHYPSSSQVRVGIYFQAVKTEIN
jgi:hypothetical protein